MIPKPARRDLEHIGDIVASNAVMLGYSAEEAIASAVSLYMPSAARTLNGELATIDAYNFRLVVLSCLHAKGIY